LQNIKVILKSQWIFLLGYFVIRNCRRGTCSSVEMLKGCMVRESLGTPALERIERYFEDYKSQIDNRVVEA